MLVVYLNVEGQPFLHEQVGVILVELWIPLLVNAGPLKWVLTLLILGVTVHVRPACPAVGLLPLFLLHVAFARIELPLISGREYVQLIDGDSESEFLIQVLIVVVILESNMYPVNPHFDVFEN